MELKDCKKGDVIFFSEENQTKVMLFSGKDERSDSWTGLCFDKKKLIRQCITDEIEIQDIYRHKNQELASKAFEQMYKWHLCRPMYSETREAAAEIVKTSAENTLLLAVYSALKFTARREVAPARQAVDQVPKGFFTAGFIVLCYQIAAMAEQVRPTASTEEDWPSDKHGVSSAETSESFQDYLKLLDHHPAGESKTSIGFWCTSATNPIDWARNPNNQFPILYWKETPVPKLQEYLSQDNLMWDCLTTQSQVFLP